MCGVPAFAYARRGTTPTKVELSILDIVSFFGTNLFNQFVLGELYVGTI
jgi:hypothetical protein